MNDQDAWRDRVVLVTGASAGVGRATALRFARRGAAVGLLARDAQALAALEQEIAAFGGRALALPADVADAEAVEAAAAQCESALGPIDVWVNNAMATVYGPVASLTPQEVRRVNDVTYLGCVHGTMAALRRMRERDRGTIVQVGSGLAYRAIPLQAAYCAAKHAARAFTDALRSELLAEGSGVRLSMVHLPAIDTPQFDWARSHMGRTPRPVAPVYAPEVAARAIERAARDAKRELWVGSRTPLMVLANALAPAWLDRLLVGTIEGQSTNEPMTRERADNLDAPVAGLHHTAGSFGTEAHTRGMVASETTARWSALGAVVAVATAAGWLAGRRGR